MPWTGGVATGIGSLPGTDAREAARTVAGELPDLPHLVELPDRGVGADMIGRAVGLLIDLHAEVVPSGWRMTRRPGRDVRRALDFLAWDLDAAESAFAGAAWVKVQVCGPWTLAAGLELGSGHRLLTDSGAVADLAASLAEGLIQHVDQLRRRVPGAQVVVQLDEPGLPAVLRGSLSTPSGFGTVPAIAEQVVESTLADFIGSLPVPAAQVVAHCCATPAPVDILRRSGFGALALDLTAVGRRAAELDPIGRAVEESIVVLAGLVPAVDPAAPPVLTALAHPVVDIFNRLGFPRSELAKLVVTPTCGLAGASAGWSRRALELSRELATALQDPPDSWV